jgi:YgiT-type zinc finger domain-containing protein
MYKYGKCHVCGQHMREKRVNQTFWIKGKLIVVENVPAGVCPQCGGKVVQAAVGLRIAALLRNRGRDRTRTISVPVIRYKKGIVDAL